MSSTTGSVVLRRIGEGNGGGVESGPKRGSDKTRDGGVILLTENLSGVVGEDILREKSEASEFLAVFG